MITGGHVRNGETGVSIVRGEIAGKRRIEHKLIVAEQADNRLDPERSDTTDPLIDIGPRHGHSAFAAVTRTAAAGELLLDDPRTVHGCPLLGPSNVPAVRAPPEKYQ